MSRPPVARFLLTIASMAVLIVGPSACRRGASGEARVVVIGSEQPLLGDPLSPPSSEASAILRLATAQGLVRFDAGGQIEPGLAERWNVSDDGMSYIFRLATGDWPDGRKIVAKDVARLLTRQIRANVDPTRDALGAVDEVVAMTDKVIEIRLRAPRPNLLTLLAQPELAIVRDDAGTGPFHVRQSKSAPPAGTPPTLTLRRRLPGFDGEEGEREDVTLSVLAAGPAIAAFVAGDADVVVGGTVVDLPLANAAKLPRGSLRFDPVAGLFGLAPARNKGPIADADVRRLLSEALDRRALIAGLSVPGLSPRSTLLQDGLDGIGTLAQPAWLDQPAAERRPALQAEAARLRAAPRKEAATSNAASEPTLLSVSLPDGPGGDIILRRLNADWGPIGFRVERAAKGVPTDLVWVDRVAPSDSPAWFLRQFRCGIAPVCVDEAEPILAQARAVPIAVQRAALFGEVARMMDEQQLFLPVAAPIRWSLVSKAAPGFLENRYGRHTLGGLGAKPRPGDG